MGSAHAHTHTHTHTSHINVGIFSSPSSSPLSPTSHTLFCLCVVHVALCCVSVRSAAPDFHKLNEDGELWLVNQGLKETIRCCCVSNRSVTFEHDLFWMTAVSLHFNIFYLFLSSCTVGHFWKMCLIVGTQESYRLNQTFYRFRRNGRH